MNKNTLIVLSVAIAALVYLSMRDSGETAPAKPITVNGYLEKEAQGEWSKRKENPLLFLTEKEEDIKKKFKEAPYDEIEFTYKDVSVTMKRAGADDWKMTTPVPSDVENFRIKNMVEAFATDTALTPARYVKNPDHLEDFGLDTKRQIKVTLKQAGEKKVDLVIGDKVKIDKRSEQSQDKYDTFVMVPGSTDQVYRAKQKDLRDPFEVKVSDIRSKKIFSFDLTEITGVIIENPANTDHPRIELAAKWAPEKKDTDKKTEGEEAKKQDDNKDAKAEWSMVSPKVAGFEIMDLRSYWSSIAKLRTQEFHMDGKAGPETGLADTDKAAKLTITLKSGKKHTLILGSVKEKDKSVYAKVADRKEYMVVSHHTQKNLIKTLGELRDKAILKISDENDISRLEITNEHTGATPLIFTKQGEKWAYDKPGAMPFQKEVKNLVSGLKHFNVTEFLNGEPKVADSGLDKPKITVKATIKGVVRSIIFGSERDSKVYAHLAGSQLWFKVGSWTRNKFDKKPGDFRDRVVIEVEPNKIKTITLAHATETLTIERVEGQDGQWVMTEPQQLSGANGLDMTACNGVANSLQSLEAKAWSPKTANAVGLDKPAFTLTATMQDGSKRIVRISDQLEDDANFMNVQSPRTPSSQVFMIDKYRVKAIRKKVADLRKDG